MHGKFLIKIITDRLHFQQHIRHIPAIFFYLGHQFRRQIAFETDRLIIISAFFNLLVNISKRYIQQLAQLLQHRRVIAALLLQSYRVPRQIVDQLSALTIQDKPARSNNLRLTQTVAVSLLGIIIPAPQLQISHASNQYRKKQQADRKHDMQAFHMMFIEHGLPPFRQ